MLQISVEFDVKSKNSSMFLIINLVPIIEREPIKAKKLNHEKRSQKTRVFEKNHQPAKTGQSRQKIGLEIMSRIKETEKCNLFRIKSLQTNSKSKVLFRMIMNLVQNCSYVFTRNLV